MIFNHLPGIELDSRHTEITKKFFQGAHSVYVYVYIYIIVYIWFMMAEHNDNNLHWVLGDPEKRHLWSQRNRADQEGLLAPDFGWVNLNISFLKLIVTILLDCREN